MNITTIHCIDGKFPENIPDGDVLVCTGDFSDFCTRREDVVAFNEALGQLPHRHKIVVPGQQDVWCQQDEPAAKAAFTNATMLIDESVEIDGVVFYGVPWTVERLGVCEAFYTSEEYFKTKLSYVPVGIDALITSSPVVSVVQRALDRIQPRIHVSGYTGVQSYEISRVGSR